jgi:transposase
MNYLHLGIDVAKLKLDVALLTDQGVHTAVFPNNSTGFRALEDWLRRWPQPLRVCLEATGSYSLGVASFLHQRQRLVSLVNPLAVHYFARTCLSRNKTDPHDALLIARYSQQYNPRPWTPPTLAQQRLQTLVRTREQILDSRMLVQQHLENAPAGAAVYFRAQLRQLQRQTEKVEQQIRQAWQAVPEMALAMSWLTSIPGIGEITAATILAILPPVEQMRSARQLAAFAGVSPCQKQSGNSPGRTRLSKLGHRRLRKALYWPAITALRCNPRAQALAQRLAEKGKRKMVIIGAVMRLLTHLIYGVLKNRHPFDPNYLQVPVAS